MMNSTKDHFIRYRINNDQDMTYILGARCKDGVVLVSDSQILRGHDEDFGDKIFRALDNALIGAAGVTGVFSRFLKQVSEHVENKQIKTWDELINVVEDLSLHLNMKYRDRVHGEALEIIMGIKNAETSAELYHITSTGISEEITKIIAIGHGEPYGSLFLKTAWDADKTMRETAILAVSIMEMIYYLGLDTSVDSVPQIWYIPFEGDIHESDRADRDKIIDEARTNYEKLRSFLEEFLEKPKLNKAQ